MKYAVLFPVSPEAEEGKSWSFVDAENPADAASKVAGRTVAMDDKALVIELDKDPVPVFAKVGWI